jgi:Na+-transporting methylmalonyl-CoA/oxaloacetate decarboxylase beta subunit
MPLSPSPPPAYFQSSVFLFDDMVNDMVKDMVKDMVNDILNLVCIMFLGVAGVEMIADGLSQNNTLLSLDLSSNAFGNVGAIALAEALHKNTSLTELQLSNNRIGG